jgi:hypothetical protein
MLSVIEEEESSLSSPKEIEHSTYTLKTQNFLLAMYGKGACIHEFNIT